MKKLFPMIMVLLACRTAVAAEFDTSNFPLFPTLLNSTGDTVASTDFEDPEVCRGCHPEIYRQWKGSMHSNAFVDPVFQALWKMGVEETDGAVENLCAGCHTAIGTLAGEVKLNRETGRFEVSEIAAKGVQCDLCHTIKASSMHLTPIMEPFNASIIVEPGDVKRGPYKDSVSPYHETEYSELHTRSEFCANCHNVFHPGNLFPIERTYDEWRNSVYAQAGIQCQDCHMVPVELAIETARTMKRQDNPGKPCIMGPQREQMFTHEFVGGNFFMTDLLGSAMHAGISRTRLQNAASLALDIPETTPEDRLVRMKVTVRNETAGHNLPTSLTEVRQVWLEVKATADGDKVLYHSGGVNEEGAIDPEAVMFNAVGMDKDGHHTVKPWELVRFESFNTIQPKGSETVPYAFLVPGYIRGPVKVTATLRYRSYDQAVAKFLLGDDAPTIPIVDMVSASGEILVR